MKIAVFTDLYLEASGGIPSSIRAQKAALEGMGHEVVVFCPGRRSVGEGKRGRSGSGRTGSDGVAGLDKNDEVGRGGVAVGLDKNEKNVVIIPTCRHLRPGGAPLARNPDTIEQWVVENYPVFTQFNLVHVHYEAGASIAGARLARRFQLPLVQTMHGREDVAVATNIPHPFKTVVAVMLAWFQAWYLPRKKVVAQDNYLANTYARARMWTLMVTQAEMADVVLTPSQHFAEKLKHYGVTGPVFAVGNGVDDGLVGVSGVGGARITGAGKAGRGGVSVGVVGDDYEVRRLVSGEPLKIIWNSRVSREKRIIPFLEAVRLAGVPIRLEVYGDGNDLRKARRYVRRHGMESGAKDGVSEVKGEGGVGGLGAEDVRVRFHGARPHAEILQKMREMHLSATVSYGFDTQGLTLLEAEATGLPVIYCDPDLGEPLPKQGGILTKTPEPGAIAEALRELYTHPERVERMSRVMLAHRGEILQSRQVRRLMKVYEALLR